MAENSGRHRTGVWFIPHLRQQAIDGQFPFGIASTHSGKRDFARAALLTWTRRLRLCGEDFDYWCAAPRPLRHVLHITPVVRIDQPATRGRTVRNHLYGVVTALPTVIRAAFSVSADRGVGVGHGQWPIAHEPHSGMRADYRFPRRSTSAPATRATATVPHGAALPQPVLGIRSTRAPVITEPTSTPSPPMEASSP